jgi:hypothetical protein
MKIGKVVSWIVLGVFAFIGLVIVWALIVRWIALG